MVHNNSSNHTTKKTVSVVGARGYSGLELVKLLMKHEQVELTHCFATKEFKLSDELLHPLADKVLCLGEDKIHEHLTDIVFLATPAEVSAELAPRILSKGKIVIDLSGAFRFSKTAGEYGLAPFCGPRNSAVSLIANPGCYASAVNMALIPLLKHGLIEAEGICIDAKSGTTGAGRKANEALLFSEVDGECLPYRIGHHQHLPEIQAAVLKFSSAQIDPHFVTHLMPVKRGITAAIFARSKTLNLADLDAAYAQEYSAYPLVRHSASDGKMLHLRHVVGTPFTHLSYSLTGNKLYLFSLIDNLLKGAASQAVENLNRCLDLAPSFSLHGEG